MLKFIIIISSILFAGTVATESIYSYSITSIEGTTIPLTAYQGKRMLIITLPAVQNSVNDSILHVIDSLGTAHADSVVIIGVPAYEDGYFPVRKNELHLWYRGILGNGIVVTDGMYTRKTSGSQQHPLFKWLTDKNKNGSFNEDVSGTLQKFIVDTDGTLSAVLGATVRLSGPAMNSLLHGQ